LWAVCLLDSHHSSLLLIVAARYFGPISTSVTASVPFTLQLGAALGPMTSLVTLRVDAGEYGTVVETEEFLENHLHILFNKNLSPITALLNLKCLAMVS
jgi:hypothetical protein